MQQSAYSSVKRDEKWTKWGEIGDKIKSFSIMQPIYFLFAVNSFIDSMSESKIMHNMIIRIH